MVTFMVVAPCIAPAASRIPALEVLLRIGRSGAFFCRDHSGRPIRQQRRQWPAFPRLDAPPTSAPVAGLSQLAWHAGGEIRAGRGHRGAQQNRNSTDPLNRASASRSTHDFNAR